MNIDNRPIDEKIADLKDKMKFTIDDIDILPDCQNIENRTLLRGILTGQWATLDATIAVLEELQKMQQPKVCKWKPEEEKKWFFYATECGKDYEEWDSDTIETLNFCPNCGGKIEIDKENPQKQLDIGWKCGKIGDVETEIV